ncbi:hypothetical protein ACIBSV_00425 [Embleya sp. NPDC050154]|uniref:hypothetical protein n=1 Tax=unclassified Embleya TaxID=2699296 RepID=UPI0037994E30
MDWITRDMLERAERFLWTSGRVLEQRRFAYLFGTKDGKAEHDGAEHDRARDRTGAGRGSGKVDDERAGVLAALYAYRSPDGGFAYGLEPDVRGPLPQPATLRTAMPILAETGALRSAETARLCDWLASVATAAGGVAPAFAGLRDYPHPPWLVVPDPPTAGLIPTGWIVGALLRAGVEHPWLPSATQFCRTAVETLATTHPYEVEAAVTFLDGTPDRAWARHQAARLGELVREQRLVLLDPAHPEQVRLAPGYAVGEYHLPHDFAPYPDSLARDWFTDAELRVGLRALVQAQEEDGGWPLRWAEWSPTVRAEARPGLTIAALTILRAYGEAVPPRAD